MEVSTYAQLHENILFCLLVVFVVSKTYIQTIYVHAYIYTYTFIHIFVIGVWKIFMHFEIVKAFMRYVARRIKRNLLVVANKRANLKLKGQLKYFLGMYCSLISAYFGQTRMKLISVSASPTPVSYTHLRAHET